MDSRFKLTEKQLECLRLVATSRPEYVAAVYAARALGWDRAAADHRLRTLERRGFLVGDTRLNWPWRRVWTLGPLSDALVERGVL